MRLPAHNTKADYAAFKNTWYGQNIGRIMTTGTRAETVPYRELPARLIAMPITHQPAQPKKAAPRWPLAARALLWALTTTIAISIAAPIAGLIYGIGHINGLWP